MDLEGFAANLEWWGADTPAGFVVGGSTGEAPLLEDVELCLLVERARETCGPDRKVLVGTGAESTRRTISLCRQAAGLGADGVLVRPPAYFRDAMTAPALAAHYEAVAEASPIPIVLYHVPKYVPVDLPPDLVAEIARHENVAGIKDSSGDLARLGALVDACEGRARVLVGSGRAWYSGLEVGAAGGILAVALVAPGAAWGVWEAWQAGDGSAAGGLQERLGPLDRAVVGRHGVPGVKYALDRLGRVGGPPRPPLRPLSDPAREEVEDALRRAGLLE